MIAFLSLVFHVVVSPFETRARLEAEIVVLRHQLKGIPPAWAACTLKI